MDSGNSKNEYKIMDIIQKAISTHKIQHEYSET